MRVVAWNMNGAKATRQGAWEYLSELRPDIALLQEVGEVPLSVAAEFEHYAVPAVQKNGQAQKFMGATLVKGQIAAALAIPAREEWIERELSKFSGNLLSHQVEPESGPPIHAINVYNPAWDLDQSGFGDIDTTGVRLTQAREKIWLGDLLWSCLPTMFGDRAGHWVIAGDFNLSESFDQWSGGPHGNLEYLNRMASLGLTECLRHFAGKPVPTFKNTAGGKVLHQMDHMFVSESLASSLVRAWVGDQSRVFDQGLSDHLPVIADFDIGG